MNTYRVDDATSAIVPCGMNSIKYIGDSWREANKVFDETKPIHLHGVILSVWDSEKRDYIVKRTKGL